MAGNLLSYEKESAYNWTMTYATLHIHELSNLTTELERAEAV